MSNTPKNICNCPDQTLACNLKCDLGKVRMKQASEAIDRLMKRKQPFYHKLLDYIFGDK